MDFTNAVGSDSKKKSWARAFDLKFEPDRALIGIECLAVKLTTAKKLIWNLFKNRSLDWVHTSGHPHQHLVLKPGPNPSLNFVAFIYAGIQAFSLAV